jgi:DNA-binding Lrp family transcriptional regulator
VPKRAFEDDPIPPIFGTRARTKVLVILGKYGPTPVRRLAALLGVDKHTAFDLVAQLARSGVVEKRRSGAAYPGLNRTFRLHDNLRELLVALAQRFEQPNPNVPKWRAGFSTSRMAKPSGGGDELDWLFGSRIRTRILVLVAAAGITNFGSIQRALRVYPLAARYAIRRLVEDGLLATEVSGMHKLVTLDEEMPVYDEFRRLLLCVARWCSRHRGLAQDARASMGYRPDRNPLTARGRDATTAAFRGRPRPKH